MWEGCIKTASTIFGDDCILVIVQLTDKKNILQQSVSDSRTIHNLKRGRPKLRSRSCKM